MSANPKTNLEQVKTAFENFRAGRTGKERLPENLWGEAIALLERYPFRVVCRELRLKPNYLRQRAAAMQQGSTTKFKLHSCAKKPRTKQQQNFLNLTASELNTVASQTQMLQLTNSCRVMIEKTDGSRLQLTVPIEWTRIEALLIGFLRG